MNALELLARQTERQSEKLIALALSLPADKLEFLPSAGNRTALNQLQECATAVSFFWDLYTTRTMEMSEVRFKEWMILRSQLTTLEAVCDGIRSDTKRMVEFILGLDESELNAPISMPWPGEFQLADVLGFHSWNMAYHEGQITFIASMT